MHKILQKQVRKYLPENLQNDPVLHALLKAVNESYQAFDRDRELSDRAFIISEEEYAEINQRLKHEIDIKRKSIDELKAGIGTINWEGKNNNTDDLLLIARYLNQQVNKRKNAELVFASLIDNLGSAILLEDEKRHIVISNQVFCDMFGITSTPDEMKGQDCRECMEHSKYLFRYPQKFAAEINDILLKRQPVSGEIVELADGRIFERSYIPIFLDKKYKGHLWSYTDITEKRNADIELRKSNERWQFALEGAGDGVVEYDFDTNEVFFSRQYKKMLGYNDDEFSNKPEEWINRIHPDDVKMVKRSNREYYDDKINSHRREYRMRHKDGHYMWILDRGMVLSYNESGRVKRIIGTHADITQRKQQEEEYKRISVVASANKNGVLFTDAAGKIFWTNEGFIKLTGYSREEIIGKTPLQLGEGPLSRGESLKKMMNAFFEGRSFDVELVHYKKDGTWFWGRITGQSIKNESGKVDHYFAMIEDITHEREIEQRIKMNEEKYRNIIANMHLGLLEVDNEDVIQFANQSFCNMSGFSLEELIGNKAQELLLQPEHLKVMQSKNASRQKGVSDAYELEITDRDGNIKWWLISGAARYNDKGEMVGSIGIHLDITDQKNLEMELREARAQAESSVNSKQTFLANMSHEIRTPMNAIRGMSRELQKTKLNQQQSFYLNTINEASENLLVVINDILDTSKIEAGKLHLEHIGFQIEKVISRATFVMRHRAEEKGLTISTTIDDRLAAVFLGDPYRLNQVLLNLLSNSVKFSDKGVIGVACNLVKEEGNKQYVQLVVSDKGIGMEKDFLANLFQSFTQEDRSVSRKYGGTGLGMTITQQLVKLMAGTILVESEKNIGTTFTITIPFEVGNIHDLVIQDVRKTDSNILKGKKILLVEDNEMNRLVTTTTLHHYNATIVEAVNGSEAVELLMRFDFDLVLMDMQMPVMDGLEATGIIRRQLKLDVPIIALTANAIKGENLRCLAAGMDDYISKPFEEEELVNMMARWLGEKSISEQIQETDETIPLFDLTKLKEISRGNEEFVKKMVDLFVEQTPASLTDLLTAFNQGNFNAIKSIAHKMKPPIDNMGIHSLKQEIRQIEALAMENQYSDELTKLIQNLYYTLTKVVELLKQEYASNEVPAVS